MNFKRRITFEESVKFANEVINTVFVKEDDAGKERYVPEIYDYVFRLMIAKYYGGYTVTGDTDADYNTAMDIDIFKLLSENIIDNSQFDGLENAVKEKINMKNNEINKANIIVTSQFDEIIPHIVELIETINKKAAEINTSDINSFIKQFGDSVTVDNFVKSYINSEFAENKQNEILDEKNKKIISLREELNRSNKDNK